MCSIAPVITTACIFVDFSKQHLLNSYRTLFILSDLFLPFITFTYNVAACVASTIKAKIVFSYLWNKGLTEGAITVALYWQQEADFPESLACAISFPHRLKRFASSSVLFSELLSLTKYCGETAKYSSLLNILPELWFRLPILLFCISDQFSYVNNTELPIFCLCLLWCLCE